MLLPVITEPNAILHKRGADVDTATLSTPEMKKLLQDMIDTMYAKDGVGLAAPQINKSLQICVIAKEYAPNKKNELILINPTWEKISKRQGWDTEGCLSVPGIFGEVKRYKDIKVKAVSPEGTPLDFEAHDFFARIIQHETDHLNGILFISKARDLHTVDGRNSL